MAQPLVWTADGKLDAAGSAVFTAAGVADVELGPVPPSLVWLITRMVVNTTGSSSSTCSVYDGAPVPANLIDATGTGQQDASDFGQPWLLRTGETVLFRWEGGAPGETATARLVGLTQVVS